MLRNTLIAAPLALLVGCAQVQTQPASPAVVAKIVAACTASGLFKPVIGIADTAIEAAVPLAAIPIALKNAGVDIVCANPVRFAGDIATVKWLTQQFIAAHRISK